MIAAAPSNFVTVSRRTLDLEDYVDVARRHVGWIVGPLLAGIVISIVVAFVLPNVYVSTAEMQITPAQISETIVKTTTNQQLNERIIQMENEILSRTSLSAIIQDPRLDLYKSDRARKPIEDVIEDMKKDIHLRIDSLPSDGARTRASAFSISFEYPDRTKVHDTVQMLITRFEDSNQTTQRTSQNVVSSYVHDELSEAGATLSNLNEELTKFRVENSGKLPENASMNLAQLGAQQQQLRSIDEGLNRLNQDRAQLETHLQTLQDQIGLLDMFDKEVGPATPLARQQNEFANQLTQADRNIETAEAALAQLERAYLPTYPEVKSARATLQDMKSRRDQLKRKQEEEDLRLNIPAVAETEVAKPGKKETNFAAAQSRSNVQGQIDATKTQIKISDAQSAKFEKDRQNVSKQIDALQAKLEATSSIQAKYAEMEANQKAASEKYQILQTKKELTDQNGELLQRKAGENLDVLDPPSLPSDPTKPKRWLIVGAGSAIAFVLGIALAGIQEAKDSSLKNLKDVRAYTNLPVLSSIPLLENTMLVRRKRRIAYLAWSAAVIIGILAVTGSLYYHYTYAV
jgi:succinoglycan biosynthesis transport protein ExoP